MALEMGFVAEAISALITMIVLTVCTFAHPTHAHCPRGWWLPEGIRRDGEFACRPDIVGGDDDVLTGHQTSVQPMGTLGGHIYCTNGTLPIVTNGDAVGCQRGGWRQ